jgi:hypothetical protein
VPNILSEFQCSDLYIIIYFETLCSGNTTLTVTGFGFPLRLHVQTSSGAHPASYPTGIGVLYPVIKQLGRETDNSSTPSAEVKNVWSYISISPYGVVLNEMQGKLYLLTFYNQI